MSNFKNINLTVNAESGQIVDSAGGDVLGNSKLPKLFYGETVVLCLSFVDNNGNKYPFNTDDSFEFSLDNNFDHSDSLMAYSDNSQVDVSGDWADINRASGKISIRVDCLTTGFSAKLGTDENMPVYMEVKRYISGSAYPSVILQNKAYARNVVKDDEGTPESADPEYYPATKTDALLDGKADKVDSATDGNFAGLDSDGNLTDSGNSASDFQAVSEKGVANGYASLDENGKVPVSQISATLINDVFTVNSEAAQLALTAQVGDVCVRSDLNKSYVHNGGTAGTMADWQELLTPTAAVLSVAGKTGAVVLVAGDITNFEAAVSANSDVSANTAHKDGDGSDHANVALNDTHRGSDGKDHSDVVLNNAHRIDTGDPHNCKAIKLDDFATPDDNTDLDATTSAHGLLPKLPGNTTQFLRGDGTFANPSGEANTASNVGSSGVGVFKQKDGVDLELYKLLASNGVSIALNGADYIDVKLALSALTAITSPAIDDCIPLYDASASAEKKISLGNLRQDIPNDQTGTTYTLVLTDAGKSVFMNNSSANTLTIPANSSVAFPVNTVIVVVMEGAGTTTIEGATGVSVNGVSGGSGDLSAQYGAVTLVKRSSDAWIAFGAIGAVA